MDNILIAVKDIIMMLKSYLLTKRSLYAFGFSLLFSLMLIVVATPRFLIESKLIETQTLSSPSSGIDNVLELVSGESSSSDAYEKFSSHLFSLETAKKCGHLDGEQKYILIKIAARSLKLKRSIPWLIDSQQHS